MGIFLRIMTFGWARAITLPPFGIYIREGYATDRLINGEKIHEAQANELLIIFWYVLYILEAFIKLPIYGFRHVYNSISFEREANGNRENPDYLKTRKHYASFKRIIR